MERNTARLSEGEFDLLVIGGGINGAAIANVAAGRGLKVALIEKGDFASGTSSKSTKLIHGGIRYLENFEFDLVYESLKERAIQLKTASHLVKPLEFFIPVYKGDRRPLWMMRLGVFLYDFLAGRYKIAQHRHLSRDEIARQEPNILTDGLVGAVSYFDAQMDDARLCLENILSASEKGAVIANYVSVTDFMKDAREAKGVKAKDLINGRELTVKAKRVICAVGPWTNYLLRMDDPAAKKKVRTTKGIHIVYKGALSNHALLISSGRDNRIFFVIPWMGHSLIGTTDTDYIETPEKAMATDADIDYLFSEAKRIFPSTNFTREGIITTFAGLRPLIRQGGKSPSKVSRKHVIFKTDSGITFVIGGKYTTYRAIAVDCLNQFSKPLHPAEEAEYRLYGSGPVAEKPAAIAKEYALDLETVNALLEKYGNRYKDVLNLTAQNPSLRERFCSCNPHIKAQVAYAVKTEMAQTSEDIIDRRLSIGYLPCLTYECRKFIEKAF